MVPTTARSDTTTPGYRTAALILHAVGGLVDTGHVRSEIAAIVEDLAREGQLDTATLEDLKVLAAPVLVGQQAAEDILNLITAAENRAAVADGAWSGLWPDLHRFRDQAGRAETRAEADYQHCLSVVRAGIAEGQVAA